MCFVKICQQCGKEFTTKRYPTQFCSPRCYNQHKRTEKNKRKLQLIKQYDRERNFVRKLFDEGELAASSVISKMETTASSIYFFILSMSSIGVQL